MLDGRLNKFWLLLDDRRPTFKIKNQRSKIKYKYQFKVLPEPAAEALSAV